MASNFFKEYFHFSKSDRNAIVILLLIIIILITLLNINRSNKSGRVVDHSKFEKEIEEYERSLLAQKENSTFDKRKDQIAVNSNVQLFYFDPNLISADSMKLLGFSSFQIHNIIKYREAGGVFNTKTDLLKIYGLNPQKYQTYAPFITIAEKDEIFAPKEKKEMKANVAEINLVEINKATIEELSELRGIGDVFANRIIKYRDLLGGFSKKEQLNEVYGLSKEIVLNILPQLEIDTTKIVKINLSKADYKTLIRHPYINKYQAKTILAYAKSSEDNILAKDLIKNNIVDSATYNKLLPYLR